MLSWSWTFVRLLHLPSRVFLSHLSPLQIKIIWRPTPKVCISLFWQILSQFTGRAENFLGLNCSILPFRLLLLFQAWPAPQQRGFKLHCKPCLSQYQFHIKWMASTSAVFGVATCRWHPFIYDMSLSWYGQIGSNCLMQGRYACVGLSLMLQSPTNYIVGILLQYCQKQKS